MSIDLTVIILSRNRQKYLLRQIKYWETTQFLILIFDQSPSSLNYSENSRNIKYFHCNLDFKDRLILASKELKSKYVIFLPDDEFLIPSSLINCIKFLEENQNYVSCAGRTIQFGVESEIFAVNIYENLSNFDLNNDKSFERITTLAYPYKFQPIHSVCRSIVWKTTSEIFENSTKFPPDMFELMYGFTAAFYGKLKVINELMNLRSLENEPINYKDWSQKFLTPSWIFSTCHFNEQSDLINGLSSANISKDFAPQILAGLYQYSKKIETNKNIFSSFQRLKKLVKLFFNLNNIKPRNTLINLCKKNSSEDIKVDLKQIDIISSILYNFHNLSN